MREREHQWRSQRSKRDIPNVFHIALSTFFNAIDCYIILKSVFLPNTWTGQQYQLLSQISRGKLSRVMCVCVLQHHSRIHHTSPKIMHLYVYIRRTFFEFLLIFSTEKIFLQNADLSYIAAH